MVRSTTTTPRSPSKAAGGGGTWAWHQDYGYWYKNGCLFPDMGSVAIAVSAQTAENGAQRLLRGSHRCGRLEHYIYGGQSGADITRVAELEDRLETVVFDAEPGDALFFHSNTLHSSSPNESNGTREVLLCCYNRASNDPYMPHHHPGYTPLSRVDDDALLRTGLTMSGHDREFMDPADDIRGTDHAAADDGTRAGPSTQASPTRWSSADMPFGVIPIGLGVVVRLGTFGARPRWVFAPALESSQRRGDGRRSPGSASRSAFSLAPSGRGAGVPRSSAAWSM